MRVTILGSSGQLASELWSRAVQFDWHLGERARVDVTDEASVHARLERERPDLVINATAYTAVDQAEREPERAFAVNDGAVGCLAKWCNEHGAALFHVSTDYVFDGRKAGAYDEADPTAPLNVYGASKLAGEQRVRAVLARHVVLRTSWVFSAHGQNFVKTVLRLARERDELRIVSDQYGKPTAASHLAEALLLLAGRLANAGTLPWGTFHFADEGATSWHGFAEAIVEAQAALTGRRPRVVAIPSSAYPLPARRPQNSVLASTRFERAFATQAPSWRNELKQIVPQLVANHRD